jgi:hypothetical protein
MRMPLLLRKKLWQLSWPSGSHIELEAYLERYPDGAFVDLAKARLEGLRDPPADFGAANAEVSEAELTFWNCENPDMCRAYLNKYPEGIYAELACINIEIEEP